MSRNERKEAPDEMLRRPGGEGDPTAALQHASHFGQRNLRAWREHVPELADYNVKALVRIRQMLGVTLGPFDRSALGDLLILSRVLEQLRR
jgi:hypothetical protein